jgi:hypothetical protein
MYADKIHGVKKERDGVILSINGKEKDQTV